MKNKKKEPLAVGQRLFLELVTNFSHVENESSIYEFEVVEANSSSAYLVEVSKIGNEKLIRYKVNQRTYEVRMPYLTGHKLILWLKKEDYESHIEYEKELNSLLKLAHEKVDTLSIDKLKEFVKK